MSNEQPNQKPDNPEQGPSVEITNLNTNATIKFHASWDQTLAEVLETAYSKLSEAKKPGDELLEDDGVVLTPYMGLTLAQLRDKKIAQNRKFELRRDTGGAAWPGQA